MKFQLIVIATVSSTALGTDADPSFLRVLQTPTTCASVGLRSKECGATNQFRPDKCCEGLICAGVKCVNPEDLGCADVGFRAMECGIYQQNRPMNCCEGLVCNEFKYCVDPEAAPTSPPVATPTERTMGEAPVSAPTDGMMVGTSYCTYSPDPTCYATGWPPCCGSEDLECPEEQPPCDVDGPVAAPVAAPVEAPVTAPVAEPQLEPVPEVTEEPTNSPTTPVLEAEAKDPAPDATSSATAIVTGFAMAFSAVAPVVLL